MISTQETQLTVSNIEENACRYRVDRPAHTEEEFQEKLGNPEQRKDSNVNKIKRKIRNSCTCSKECVRGFFSGLFPIFTWLRHYKKRWLLGDIVSGITVGVVHIPQSLAFSILAGLAPVFGLYTSFYPVLIYTLMGTSRHISVGTFAVTSLLTRSVVFRYFPPDESSDTNANLTDIIGSTTASGMDDTSGGLRFTELDLQRAGVAAAVAFVMGAFQILFGILRLGFITSYMSEPLIQGFTTGAACQVVTSQVPTVLGITITLFNGPFALILSWIEIFKNLPNTHIATLVLSILCFIFLIAGREINLRLKHKMKIPLPTEVILVVITILASHFGQFNERFGVVIVDNIPTGLPAPVLPSMNLIGDIIGDGFAIAIVGFAINVSIAKMYGIKYGYSINSNQELLAYGTSNIIPSFFLCFPNAAALARCEIQDNTGGNTQVVGIITVFIVLIVVLVLGPVFEPLPRAVLGCIIIVGLFGILANFGNLKNFYKTSKIDFAVWLVTWLAVVVLGVDLGLFTGILFAIITVIVRTQVPRFEVLENVTGTDLYRTKGRYQKQNKQSGIVIVKLHASLYYINKDFFKRKLIQSVGFDPGDVLAEKKKTSVEKEIDRANSSTSFKENNNNRRLDHLATVNQDGISSASIDLSEGNYKDEKTKDIYAVVLDCGSFGFTDYAGGKLLKQLCKQFSDLGVSFYLANCSVDVLAQLERSGFVEVAGNNAAFVSVHDAVLYAMHNKSR